MDFERSLDRYIESLRADLDPPTKRDQAMWVQPENVTRANSGATHLPTSDSYTLPDGTVKIVHYTDETKTVVDKVFTTKGGYTRGKYS